MHQTKTENFKKWFGDWEKDPGSASKVVDEDGKPLALYHGTQDAGFTSFDSKTAADIDGYYFVKQPEYADNFSTGGAKLNNANATGKSSGENSGTYKVFLNIKNPITFTDNINKHPDFASKVASLENTGVLVDDAIKNNKTVEDVYNIALEKYKYDIQTEALNQLENMSLKDLENGVTPNKYNYLHYYEKITGHPLKMLNSKGATEEQFSEMNNLAERALTVDANKKATDLLKSLKYDGAIRPDVVNHEDEAGNFSLFSQKRINGVADTYIPFYSNQIKSATGNNGKFSSLTSNINGKVPLKELGLTGVSALGGLTLYELLDKKKGGHK